MRQRVTDQTEARKAATRQRAATRVQVQAEKATARQLVAEQVPRPVTPRLLPVWALLLITVPVGAFILMGFIGAMIADDVVPGAIMLLVVGAPLVLLWHPRRNTSQN